MEVRCIVCGERWEYHGIDRGDMEKWEAKLFKEGAGCPACEGVVDPESRFRPTSLADLEFGSQDPIHRIHAYERSISGNPIKWEKPEPKFLWSCDGCGVSFMEDANGDVCAKDKDGCMEELRDMEREPFHEFKGGQKVCIQCLDHCCECGAEISSSVEFDSCEDDGYSIPSTDGMSGTCFECHRDEDEQDGADAPSEELTE